MKTLIICTWLGDWPPYLPFFVAGVCINPGLHWLIVTDNESLPDDKENLRFVHKSREDLNHLIISTLINQIVEYSHHSIIVLDDYHHVNTKAIHDCLNFFLDNLPPNIHFIVCSRIDPPFSMSRLRARGQLLEIRSKDLRFTKPEVSAFLNDMIELNLAPEEISTLLVRTEGWITGLQMAALSMKSQDDIQGFIRSFTGDNRYVMDYLVEEVISVQSEMVKTFLLQILLRFVHVSKQLGDIFGRALLYHLLQLTHRHRIVNYINGKNRTIIHTPVHVFADYFDDLRIG